MINTKRRYTLGHEIFNSVSHGIGAGLAIAGTVLLIIFAAINSNAWAVVSVSIYGVSLILFFVMSSIYHGISSFNARNVLRVFDHLTIFFLIAGTYTPLTLITLRGVWGWILFGIEWAAAIVGIVLTSSNFEKFRKYSLVFYFTMGWLILLFAVPAIKSFSTFAIIFLLIGGVLYTGGAILYAVKQFKYAHAVYHVIVLAGSIFHFFAILSLVS
jgi:hemolysin III